MGVALAVAGLVVVGYACNTFMSSSVEDESVKEEEEEAIEDVDVTEKGRSAAAPTLAEVEEEAKAVEAAAAAHRAALAEEEAHAKQLAFFEQRAAHFRTVSEYDRQFLPVAYA